MVTVPCEEKDPAGHYQKAEGKDGFDLVETTSIKGGS